MVIKILVIFVIGIIYLFIGIGIIFVIDNATLSVLEPTEIVAVILFYPIIGVVMAVMGCISLIIKYYNELKETMSEGEEK